MKTVKQYRNLIFGLMGISFVIAITGLILLIGTRGAEGVSMLLTKIGVIGVVLSYGLSLFVAISRWKQLAQGTKIVLLAAIALSIPIVYGLFIVVLS